MKHYIRKDEAEGDEYDNDGQEDDTSPSFFRRTFFCLGLCVFVLLLFRHLSHCAGFLFPSGCMEFHAKPSFFGTAFDPFFPETLQWKGGRTNFFSGTCLFFAIQEGNSSM